VTFELPAAGHDFEGTETMDARWISLVCVVLLLSVNRDLKAQTVPSCCFCGKKVCVLEVSQETEDVVGFKVEPKEICIPGIRLPWDPCGTRRCGGVRNVCVLSEVTEEKSVCKYEWSIKTICTKCCKRHGLKHSHHQAQLQTDERVPFEYYTAPLAEQADEQPVASVPDPGSAQPMAGERSFVVDRLPVALQQSQAADTVGSGPSQFGVVRQVSATIKRWFERSP
jgi:hypothetical protein